MKLLRRVFCLSLLLIHSAVCADVDPAEKLQIAIKDALDIVYGDCCRDLPIEEKESKVREILTDSYDLDVIIRNSIGRNWNLLEESERPQVVELIKRLIIRAYLKGLDGRERPEITFGDTLMVTSKRSEVPSVVELDGKSVHILYRFGRLESGWQIYDIVAEDISVVSNFRQQFDDHFRKGDGAGLIAKLKELLDKEDLTKDVKI